MSLSAEQTNASTGRRFHLKQIIGEGAFGEVYLAEQDSGAGFRRKVAIKLLNSNVARSREAGRRMRDEARILGLLSHRNIVTVLDLVRLGERWAVIMDFVPGADLEQVLEALSARSAAFPVAAALEVGACVCAALDAAHTAEDGEGAALRVVHRDIKPSNVRLTLDGDVKVLDFGVARVELDARESATRGSAWLGTERYMSPERILCESDDTPGDIYATAATVLELMLGRPLGRTPVLEERHRPFVDEALEQVASSIDDPEFAASVCDLLRSALAASPAARPDARAFADALRALARRGPGETLVEFCRRFVPLVPEILGRGPRPASGVLSEATGTSGSQAALAASAASGETVQSAPTLMPDEIPSTPLVDTSPSGSTDPPRRGGGLLIAIGALLALGGATLLGGAGLVLSGAFATSTPSEVSPEAPTPAPAPVAEPQSNPEPEPAPEPEPTPEPAPAPVVPAPVAQPEPIAQPTPIAPTRPRPDPAPAPAPAPAPVAADAPRVDSALVALPDASGLQVRCGDVDVSGTASVRLRNFPAGDCEVRATWLGRPYATTVRIDRRREVRCAVDGGQLACS